MAYQINLKTFTDSRGNLTVIERVVPFPIKRIFYIYGVDSSIRGGHRHHKTVQAAICVQGSCTISNHDGKQKEVFELNTPGTCLIINPADWHLMYDFTPDAILMVLASEHFDPVDYIYEPYPIISQSSETRIPEQELYSPNEDEINRYHHQPEQSGWIGKHHYLVAQADV